ncbi:MAG TPA: SprT-like domain-containing protein [Bryobacteraceae bacterium]|nr:SprT-like domain-containing protein [Bryobacteraceae bacterium]
MQVESALFSETPEEIYTRVFREVKPRTPVPAIRVLFCRFANANSFIRLENGTIEVKVTDVLQEAPAPILEALAYILISKLYRNPVPSAYNRRYRLYLNQREIRAEVHRVRQERGRKLIRPPKGKHYDLTAVFEDINFRFFFGLMSMPNLGWSLRPSKTTLGHYDPSHHSIILSSELDRPDVPQIAVDYVMFHEMLHLRFPVEHRGLRRCVHTPEFKEAEKAFPNLAEAKFALRRL